MSNQANSSAQQNSLKVIVLDNFDESQNSLDRTLNGTLNEVLPSDEFYKLFTNTLKISSKNRALQSKFKRQTTAVQDEVTLSEAVLTTEIIEEVLDRELEKSRKKHKKASYEAIKEAPQIKTAKLDSASCFIWFIVRKNDMKNVVPDMELVKYKQVCLDMIARLSTCTEAHFGIAKLLANEGKFDSALQHLKICVKEQPSDKLYFLWYAVMMVLSVESKAAALEAKNVCYKCIKNGIKGVEIYWALMELSLLNFLKIGTEIESPEHYATRIKDIDDYYGLLAWSELSVDSRELEVRERAEFLLKELISDNPQRPEAYMKLWYYYYFVTKNYESALDIIETAFLKLSDIAPEYSILISLKYSKNLFRIGKSKNAFELLQIKYMKLSLYPVYLCYYGKLCIKSTDAVFIGSGVGALTECLKVCAESRHGQAYYWLSKGYLLVNEKINAYNCMKEAIPLLTSLIEKVNESSPEDKHFEKKILTKINELKELMKTMYGDIVNFEIIERVLKSDTIDNAKIEECKIYCNSLRNFDCVEADICESKVLWKAGMKEEAYKILQNSSNRASLSMKSNFQLLEFLIEDTNYNEVQRSAKNLIKKCKSSSIPAQVWVKAHMIYAKALVKNENISKAILIYKTLAQIQPNLFVPDVGYTKELQKATTKEDLINANETFQKKKFMTSFLYSEALSDLDSQRARLISSRKNLMSSILNEDGDIDSPYKQTSSDFPKLLINDTEHYISDSNPKSNPLQGLGISRIPIGDSANISFSACSDYLFLYKIGKIAAKYNKFIEDGVQALHDFLNIHHYWMKEGIEADEDLRVKALYYLGVLCHIQQDFNQAYTIFRDIMSMLFQLGRTSMSNQIQEYFKQYESLGIKPPASA